MEKIDFSLNVNSYAGFDAATIRQLFISNLQQSELFKDANFEGSNISSILSMQAYANHMLLWYLNNTSAESTFSYAELYEAINKITKILNYNPVGRQSAVLSFNASASAQITPGNYVVPRFSYIVKNGINYSFKEDVNFTKVETGIEELTDFSKSNLLYQGVFKQYPPQATVGEDYEVINLGLKPSDVTIDHNSLCVFVLEPNGNWEEYNRVDCIFTETNTSKCFEARFNEYERYEIKFGNNINGYKPVAGSTVIIYYLASDGAQGEVDVGGIDGSNLFLNQDPQFLIIFNDIISSFIGSFNIINADQALQLTFTNSIASTNFADKEKVTNIKQNATNLYKSQYRLVTASDYENIIKFKFSNIISSVKIVSNKDYIGQGGHLYYTKNLGLTQANQDSKILSNQIQYADSCDFNNVYIYGIPKFFKSAGTRPIYLTNSQKNSIINDISDICYLNAEPVFIDPVYTSFKIGFGSTPGAFKLIINKNTNSFINNNTLKQQVYNQILSFFDPTLNVLGQYLSISKLNDQILAINGVSSIQVTNGETTLNGLSFSYSDPLYPDIISSTDHDIQLEYFKFPYIENTSELLNAIQIN